MLTFKQPSDAVLSAYFREHKKLGRQDRHEIAETAFAALRHYQKISTALRRPHAQPRKAALAALVLGRSTNISQIKDLLDEEETEFLGNLKARKTEFSDGLNTAAELPQCWWNNCNSIGAKKKSSPSAAASTNLPRSTSASIP